MLSRRAVLIESSQAGEGPRQRTGVRGDDDCQFHLNSDYVRF